MPRTEAILRTASTVEKAHLVVHRWDILSGIKPDVLHAIDELGWPAILDHASTHENLGPELAKGLAQFAEAVHVPDFVAPRISLLATGYRYARLIGDGLSVTSAVECAICDTLFRGGSIALGAKAGVAIGALISGPVGALVGMFTGGFMGGKLGRSASRAAKTAAFRQSPPPQPRVSAVCRSDRGIAATAVRERCHSICAKHAKRRIELETAARS